MLLLGFGLVHIPRTMLHEADPAQRLRHAYHKCVDPPPAHTGTYGRWPFQRCRPACMACCDSYVQGGLCTESPVCMRPSTRPGTPWQPHVEACPSWHSAYRLEQDGTAAAVVAASPQMARWGAAPPVMLKGRFACLACSGWAARRSGWRLQPRRCCAWRPLWKPRGSPWRGATPCARAWTSSTVRWGCPRVLSCQSHPGAPVGTLVSHVPP